MKAEKEPLSARDAKTNASKAERQMSTKHSSVNPASSLIVTLTSV